MMFSDRDWGPGNPVWEEDIQEEQSRRVEPTNCPTCDKELVENPISGYPSCFLHGDYYLNKDIKWVWKPMNWDGK